MTAQGTMSRLQEDFWEQVAKPYGYERPMRHELRAKGYRSLDAYKVQVGATRALKSEIETLEGARDKAKHGAITAKRELDGLEQLRVESSVKLGAVNAKVDEKRAQAAEIDRRIAEKMAELDRLDGEIGEKIELRNEVGDDLQRESARLESLRQGTRAAERDVEELRPIATEVRGWEAAGKAERGAILDNIVVKCDGLASRIRAGVAGIRLKVEELRSRISRPLEYLMRKEQPMRQSFDDMLRDARRAADAWNRDHAAPQRTYRGRAR